MAPIIFSGKAIEVIEEKDSQGILTNFVRFEVTHVFKGPDQKYLIIQNKLGEMAANAGGGKEVTLIPDVLENGSLAMNYCSLGVRNQNVWLPEVKYAYSTPFPELYLLRWYVLSLLFFFPVFLACRHFYRKGKE